MLKQATANTATAVFAAAGTTAISLGAQLNEQHMLFYLYVPFWMVLVAVVVVVIIGAWLNTLTERSNAIAGKMQMFVTSIAVGLLVTLIVVPIFNDKPNPSQMLLWAFSSSFFGVGAAFILADVKEKLQASDKLKDGLTNAVIDAILSRLKALPEVFKAIGKVISGDK